VIEADFDGWPVRAECETLGPLDNHDGLFGQGVFQAKGFEVDFGKFVTSAGAGLRVPDVRRLMAEIGRLRRDHDAIEAMAAASARLGRPDAAGHTARLIADLIPASSTAMRAVSCARP